MMLLPGVDSLSVYSYWDERGRRHRVDIGNAAPRTDAERYFWQ